MNTKKIAKMWFNVKDGNILSYLCMPQRNEQITAIMFLLHVQCSSCFITSITLNVKRRWLLVLQRPPAKYRCWKGLVNPILLGWLNLHNRCLLTTALYMRNSDVENGCWGHCWFLYQDYISISSIRDQLNQCWIYDRDGQLHLYFHQVILY